MAGLTTGPRSPGFDPPQDGIAWRGYDDTLNALREKARPVLVFVMDEDGTRWPFLREILKAMPLNATLRMLLAGPCAPMMFRADAVPYYMSALGVGVRFHIALLSPTGLTPLATFEIATGKPAELVAEIVKAIEAVTGPTVPSAESSTDPAYMQTLLPATAIAASAPPAPAPIPATELQPAPVPAPPPAFKGRKFPPRPPRAELKVTSTPFVVGVIHVSLAVLLTVSVISMFLSLDSKASPAVSNALAVSGALLGGVALVFLVSGLGLVNYQRWSRYVLIPLLVISMLGAISGAMGIASGKSGPSDLLIVCVLFTLFILDLLAFKSIPVALSTMNILASRTGPDAPPALPSRIPLAAAVVHVLLAALLIITVINSMHLMSRFRLPMSGSGTEFLIAVCGVPALLLVVSAVGLAGSRPWARLVLIPLVILLAAGGVLSGIQLARGITASLSSILVLAAVIALDILAFRRLSPAAAPAPAVPAADIPTLPQAPRAPRSRKWMIGAAAAATVILAVPAVLIIKAKIRDSAIEKLWADVGPILAGDDAKEWERGASLCRTTLASYDVPIPRYLLGRLLAAQRRNREAVQELDRALSMDPALHCARTERGLIDSLAHGLRCQSAWPAASVEEFETRDAEARTLRERALKDLADLPEVRYLRDSDRQLVRAEIARLRREWDAARSTLLQLKGVGFRPDRVNLALAWIGEARNEAGEVLVHASASEWVEAVHLRARVQAMTKDHARAVESFQAVLKLAPDHETAQLELAEALLAAGSPESIAAFDTVIRRRPTDAAAFEGRARARVAKGDFTAAVLDYSEALRLGADSADAWLGRARARVAADEVAAAVADFDEALKRRPRDLGVLADRAGARAVAGNLEGAHQDYTAVIEASPKDVNAVFRRGLIEWQRGDFARADADFIRAEQIDRRHPGILAARTDVRLAMGDLVGAIEKAGEAIDVEPANPARLERRATLRHWGCDLAGAIADCDALLKLQPTHVPGLAIRAWNRMLLRPEGWAELARADCRKALTLNPKHPGAISARVLHAIFTYTATDGPEDEVVQALLRELEEVRATEPKCVEAYICRSILHTGQNLADKSAEALDQAVRLNPLFVFGRTLRAKAYEEKTDYKHAIDEYQGVLPLVLEPAWIVGRLAACNRDWAAQVAVTDYKKAAQLRETAMRHYTKLSELEPYSASPLYERGRLHAFVGQWDKAISDFTAALKLEPEWVDAYVQRAESNSARRQYKAAIADYSSALRLDPDLLAALFGRAGLRFDQAEHLDAIADLDRVLKIDPSHFEAVRLRGISKYTLRQYSGAIEDFTAALKLDPTDAELPARRALARDKAGDGAGALADYAEALRLRPKYAAAFKMRGDLHFRADRYKEAIADYDDAVKIEPDNAWAYHNRGQARVYLEKWDEAIADFDLAIKHDPDEPDHYSARGRVRWTKKDVKGAGEDFNRAIRADPGNSWAHHLRAQLRIDAGDADGAIADCTAAMKSNPEYPNYYATRAIARLKKGDRDKAFDDLQEAVRLKSDDPEVFENRGDIFVARGEKAKAAADYKRALELSGPKWERYAGIQKKFEDAQK